MTALIVILTLILAVILTLVPLVGILIISYLIINHTILFFIAVIVFSLLLMIMHEL